MSGAIPPLSNTPSWRGSTLQNKESTGTTYFTARSGRELYHSQFLLQAASPETFGYTLVVSHLLCMRTRKIYDNT
jgi:hypothetical protein